MDTFDWKIRVNTLNDIQKIITICLGLGVIVPRAVSNLSENDISAWPWFVGKYTNGLRLDCIGEQPAQLKRLEGLDEFQLDSAYESISDWVRSHEPEG